MVRILYANLFPPSQGAAMKVVGRYRLEYEYEFQCSNLECNMGSSFSVKVDIIGADPLFDDDMKQNIDPHSVACTSMNPPSSGMALRPLLHPDDEEPAWNQYNTVTPVPPDPVYGACAPQRVMRRLVVNAADLNEDDSWLSKSDEIFLKITLTGPSSDEETTNVVKGKF